MTTTGQESRPVVVRAKEDDARDRSLADEAQEAADVAALHGIVVRLLADRRQLAESFDALIRGWSIMGRDTAERAHSAPDKDAIAAIERVATEAIALASEVIRAGKSVTP